MPAYSFHCTSCGLPAIIHASMAVGPKPEPCANCGTMLTRNYRAEGVGLSGMVTLRHERELGGTGNAARAFLPTNDDFAGPGDPDGTKGMREWRETHEPRETNKRPHWPGEVEKKTFAVGGN